MLPKKMWPGDVAIDNPSPSSDSSLSASAPLDPPPIATLPTLPTKIISQILDQIIISNAAGLPGYDAGSEPDLGTLSACCRVSHAFLQPARTKLHNRIIIALVPATEERDPPRQIHYDKVSAPLELRSAVFSAALDVNIRSLKFAGNASTGEAQVLLNVLEHCRVLEELVLESGGPHGECLPELLLAACRREVSALGITIGLVDPEMDPSRAQDVSMALGILLRSQRRLKRLTIQSKGRFTSDIGSPPTFELAELIWVGFNAPDLFHWISESSQLSLRRLLLSCDISTSLLAFENLASLCVVTDASPESQLSKVIHLPIRELQILSGSENAIGKSYFDIRPSTLETAGLPICDPSELIAFLDSPKCPNLHKLTPSDIFPEAVKAHMGWTKDLTTEIEHAWRRRFGPDSVRGMK